MTDSHLIPIRFYADFVKKDWPALPNHAQDSLANFLLKLQKDPTNREVLDQTERDRAGHSGYEFSPGFVVYWQLVGDIEPPGRIEVLALLKNEVGLSETPSQCPPDADASEPEQQDSLKKVYSRTTRFDNLNMWGSLHVSRRTGRVAGWIVDSWSEWGYPPINPKLYWVSFPDHKLYHMQLNIDFRSTIRLGPEDAEIEPQRLIFIRATLAQWERDWLEQGTEANS